LIKKPPPQKKKKRGGGGGLIFLWTGNENNLYFQFAGSKTVARVSKYEISQIGDKVSFVFMPHKLHFFDSTTEKTI